MVAKSVIDIEVNADKFKEFQKIFDKHKAAVNKLSGEWAKVNSSVDGATSSFSKIEDSLDTIDNKLAKTHKTLKSNGDVSGKMAKNFENIAKSAKSMSLFVAESTFNIVKWGVKGAALGLLGVGGGLFGLSKLASSASDSRTQSQSLGISSGELKAAKINYGRYGDAEGLLQGIADAKNDLTRQWAFQAAGLDSSQSAATLLPQAFRKAGQVYNAGPEATAGQRLAVSGLTSLGVDVSQARQASQIKNDELSISEKKYNQDIRSLAVNDKLLRNWQELDVQLDRAGSTIVNSFIVGLNGLAQPIAELSSAFADGVSELLKSPKIGEWVEKLGDGIRGFAEYLSGPKLERDLESFLNAIQSISRALVNVSEFINNLFHADNSKATVGTVFSSEGQKAFTNNFLHPDLKLLGGHDINDQSGLVSYTDKKSGRSYSKNGVLVSSVGSPRKMGLVPFSQVPVIQKSVNSEQGSASTASTVASQPTQSQRNAMYAWNPTSTTLVVKTTKTPGSETNVNMLNAANSTTRIVQQ